MRACTLQHPSVLAAVESTLKVHHAILSSKVLRASHLRERHTETHLSLTNRDQSASAARRFAGMKQRAVPYSRKPSQHITRPRMLPEPMIRPSPGGFGPFAPSLARARATHLLALTPLHSLSVQRLGRGELNTLVA